MTIKEITKVDQPRKGRRDPAEWLALRTQPECLDARARGRRGSADGGRRRGRVEAARVAGGHLVRRQSDGRNDGGADATGVAHALTLAAPFQRAQGEAQPLGRLEARGARQLVISHHRAEIMQSYFIYFEFFKTAEDDFKQNLSN